MYLVISKRSGRAGGKLPVPKYSWKVVQDPDTKKAIGFVTINNPFIDSVAPEDLRFCKESICGKYGWGVAAWTNPSKGYTYCCDVNELRKNIKTIPEVEVKGVLEANKIWFRHLH